MSNLLGKLVWLVAAATTLLPVLAEARLAANHNETFVHDAD
jgi:hypothetical protein